MSSRCFTHCMSSSVHLFNVNPADFMTWSASHLDILLDAPVSVDVLEKRKCKQTLPEEACSGFCVVFPESQSEKKSWAHFFGHSPKTLPKSTLLAHFVGYSPGRVLWHPSGTEVPVGRWLQESRWTPNVLRGAALTNSRCSVEGVGTGHGVWLRKSRGCRTKPRCG